MQRNYSQEKLMQMAKHRGYFTTHAIARTLSQNTGLSVATWENKLSSGHLSREEMIVIAAWFEMTPKEFCDVFLHGLFAENDLGHFEAHIDCSAYAFLHPPKKSQAQIRREKEQQKREEMLAEIAELGV